jgi:phosphoribosylanthranilate isomerase
MINGRIIKVCGMREAANIQAVERLEAVDWMGFIFYPHSSRYMVEMPDYLPTRARRIGVFVNEEEAKVPTYIERFGLEYVQLHGHESPDYCRSLRSCGVKIIKAFSIAELEDLLPTQAYEESCDLFLFDTRCNGYGGSGQTFDWEVLSTYTGSRPFLLSGGIGPDSVGDLQRFTHPRLAGYDLNSRFETAPGLKNVATLHSFFNELNK